MKKREKSIKNILTYNVTEVNDIIYTWADLVYNKMGNPQKNQNKNIKAGCEMRLEGQIKKLKKTSINTKEGKILENKMDWKVRRKSAADKTDDKTERNNPKEFLERRETQNTTGENQEIQAKQVLSNIKDNFTNKLAEKAGRQK